MISNINQKKIRRYRIFKLIFDVPIALIAIIILLPVYIILILVIIFDSKGTPFFLQERIGLFGKNFKIIKFRTMVINAENIGDKMCIEGQDDPRITKIGRFLRKTSLDELPQLFNILKGDMAIIGPRPPLTYHPYEKAENFPEWAKLRFLIRPGVTGLAQVTVRNAVPWDDRMKYDIEYIENMRILTDLKIVWLTIMRIIKPQNMYLDSQHEDKEDIEDTRQY